MSGEAVRGAQSEVMRHSLSDPSPRLSPALRLNLDESFNVCGLPFFPIW